ncbi:OadG family protein [Porticoccaceae bacterium]|jgi:oxaloacetate decarboxylase gamma subunit|nr:OadG family protein [Porticoccaceae bacterium]
MDSILIAQGLDLMLYGMGTVFTFLTVLVVITSTMSALVNRIATEDVVATSAPSADNTVEPRLATVIQAAIDQHRGRK